MRSQALRADIMMLFAAFIWGVSFVVQQVGMDSIGPFLYTGLRFSLGALALLPLFFLPSKTRRTPHEPMSRSLLLAGVSLGLVLTIGISFQQVGLLYTSVTNSGFITCLYVIIVPVLGLAFGQHTHLGTWLGASLAVIGMYLLSVGDGFKVASGDWLQLAGAFVWGGHVLLVGYFARRHDPIRLSILQFAVCAVLSLIVAVIVEPIRLGDIQAAAWTIAYGGLLSVGIGFTLQVVAQRHAIASHAAIILSMEAVFAALAGAVFLGETLHAKGYIGTALMLAGMLLAQLWPRPNAAKA